MAEDPYRYFRLEAREILDQFSSAMLELEKSGDAGQVQRLLRLGHTLKGAARVVKQPEIADAAHAIEEELSLFREGPRSVPRERIDAVLGHLSSIAGRVVSLESPKQAEATPSRQIAVHPAADGAGEEPIRTVRADIADLDALLDGVSETHALLGGLRGTLRSVEQARHLADLMAEQLTQHDTAVSSLPSGSRDAQSAAVADDLRRQLGNVERQFTSMVDQIDRELQQLRDAAEQLRLVGAGSLLTFLERTALDTGRALSKDIVFEASGGGIRLDADILAAAQGALVQLVRNAVAHGIESAEVRRAVGKPAAGRIAVDVTRRGNRIVFRCEDDGGGVNVDEVRRAALRRGLDPAAVGRFTAQDLMNLLLRGGLSTSASVTEIAGRGIGLDVVREASERLGGTVEVATETGKGTSFELAAPLSLVSVEALVIEAAGTIAAVPLDAVHGTLLVGADEVSRDAGGATILHDERVIPFLWLPRILDGRRLAPGHKWPAIVVVVPAGTAVIGVNSLLGISRTVLRPLPEFAAAAPFVAGAALDAEGNPRLVLSPDGLVSEAQRQDSAEPEPEPKRHPILVVDDSLTTRMLEQSILESAGYEVDLAISAENALEIARRKRYALFLVDVEMPGMDGFSFVERIRADPALHDIPAVLVTSRAAPEDRRRGRDAGAHGYIVKGEFNQAELLAMIRPLIG